MALTESQLQQICVQYFNSTYPNLVIAASLNGVKLGGKGKYGVIKKQLAEGLLRGFPDLEVLLPEGRTIYLELKTETGKQSQDQIDLQAKMEALGHKYYLVRNFQEFKQIIQDNLSLSDNN